MSAVRGRVLVVDDERAMGDMLARALSQEGFRVDVCVSGAEALEKLGREDYDALVTDLAMGGMNGLQLCERAVATQPGLPVLVMTAFGSMDTAVEALRLGAYDFLTKPFEMEVATMALGRAVEYRRLRSSLARLERASERSARLDELFGESLAMEELRSLMERVSDSEVTVVVTGESGTGKELVARTLHRTSARRDGPFVAVNCAALPESLLESELFGHVRGAFTDARTARAGLFVQASAGTLLLDEIGEMPLEMQAKLLRALQDRMVRPLGSDREVPFDARIVAATNRDLEAAVEDGLFREDLYFRLAVLELEVPPLRDRGNDVLELARRFLAKEAAQSAKGVTGLSPEVAQRLLSYTWPGNVRELQNCIQRAVALARFESLVVGDLPERIRAYRTPSPRGGEQVEMIPLEEVERRHVMGVLAEVEGQRKKAARILGVDRKTLYRKLERWRSEATRKESGPG